MLDPTPWVGGVRPFLMQSSFQFRTDGPNALTSDAYTDDFNEVKALGSVNSTVRTAEQTHIALFWQSTAVATWNAVARNLAENPNYDVDTADAARLFAMLNLTAADAAINCWNDKYYWDFWRPWTAIHQADRDGNPATEPDSSWTALLTPYPEHPSGHLCFDGASLRVLQQFFGTDKIRFGVTSVRFPSETRYFDRFSDALQEIIDARIWAGLHFRTADEQGQILGMKSPLRDQALLPAARLTRKAPGGPPYGPPEARIGDLPKRRTQPVPDRRSPHTSTLRTCEARWHAFV
jgi:PAP2 superfamily